MSHYHRAAVVVVIPLLLACSAVAARAQSLPPLTQEELILLFQRRTLRNNPERVLRDFVQQNGIAFLPTRTVRRRLNQAGVPRLVTDELKNNFSSKLMYQVCAFEPENGMGERLARRVSNSLDQSRIDWKSDTDLLAEKRFNPILCASTGPSRDEVLADQHTSYIAVLGDVEERASGRWIATIHLVFISPQFHLMSITPSREFPFRPTEEEIVRVSRSIAEWSVRAVEAEIR